MALLACGGKGGDETTKKSQDDAAPSTVESPVATRPQAKKLVPLKPNRLSWIFDDYQVALAEARKRKQPIFAFVWAPWSAESLATRIHLVSNSAMEAHKDSFVWLAMDFDSKDNDEALIRLMPPMLPTIYVLDPDDETIAARHLGSASQRDIERVLRAATPPQSETSKAMASMQKGHKLRAQGKLGPAAKAYDRAFKSSKPDWEHRSQLLLARIETRFRMGKWGACYDVLDKAWQQPIHRSASLNSALTLVVRCLDQEKNQKRAQAIRLATIDALAKTKAPEDEPLSASHHGDLLRVFRQLTAAAGQDQESSRWGERRQQFLDRSSEALNTSAERRALLWPLVEAYSDMGRAASMVGLMETWINTRPGQFDPPYLLAYLLHKVGDQGAALKWATRAQALTYGRRHAAILELIARIHTQLGDRPAAERAWSAVVDLLGAETLVLDPLRLDAAKLALAKTREQMQEQ